MIIVLLKFCLVSEQGSGCACSGGCDGFYSKILGVDLSSSFLRMSAGSANFARKIIAAMMYGL